MVMHGGGMERGNWEKVYSYKCHMTIHWKQIFVIIIQIKIICFSSSKFSELRLSATPDISEWNHKYLSCNLFFIISIYCIIFISFFMGSPRTIYQTHLSFISCIGRLIFFFHWVTWEALWKRRYDLWVHTILQQGRGVIV